MSLVRIAHLDGCLEVKVQILVRLDKLVKLLHVLQLGVAVEQQRGVVLVRKFSLMQCLQVPGPKKTSETRVRP